MKLSLGIKGLGTAALFLLLLCFGVSAQTKDFNYQHYDWEPAKPDAITAAEKRMPSLYLFDKRIVEFAYSASGELECYYVRHKKIHLNEEKAVEENNRITLPVGDQSNIIRMKVRAISPAGKVIELGPDDAKEIEEGGSKYKILAVEGLEPGAQLEFLTVMRIGTRYWDDEKLQLNEFARAISFDLISPSNLVFEFKGYNGVPAAKDTLENEKNIYSVRMTNVPAPEKKEYSFKGAEALRLEYKLAYNSAKDKVRLFTWSDAGKRFYEIFNTLSKDDLKIAKKVVQTAKLVGKDELATVQNLDNYLKNNINVQDFNTPEGNSIALILKNKYATKMGMAKVYAALLNEMQIPYEIVFTSDRTEKRFDGDFDSWSYLDKILLYFPNLNQYLYPEDNTYRLGLIPHQIAGTNGLFIRSFDLGSSKTGIASVGAIPFNELKDNMDTFICDVKFASNLYDLTLNVRHSMSGYTAQEIRPTYYFLKEDARQNLLTTFLKLTSGDGKISETRASNFDLNGKEVSLPFIIDGKVVNSTSVEKAGDKYIFKIGTLIGEQQQLYEEKNRTSDIYLTYPHGYLRRIAIAIPEGYKFSGLEGLKKKIEYSSIVGSSPDLGFFSEYKLNGNTLEVTIHEYYSKLEYKAAAYPHFREVINAAADFNKVTLVLEKI